MVPVREPHGPPDRIGDGGPMILGIRVPALKRRLSQIGVHRYGRRLTERDGYLQIYRCGVHARRPFRNCTAGTISSESRADMPTAPWRHAQRDHGMQDPGLRHRHPHLSRFARQLCGGEARRGGARDEGSPQRTG